MTPKVTGIRGIVRLACTQGCTLCKELLKDLDEFRKQFLEHDEKTRNTKIEKFCKAVRAIADKFKNIEDALKPRMTTELEETFRDAHDGFLDSTEFHKHLQEHGKQLLKLDDKNRNNRITQYREEVGAFADKFENIRDALKQMND